MVGKCYTANTKDTNLISIQYFNVTLVPMPFFEAEGMNVEDKG